MAEHKAEARTEGNKDLAKENPPKAEAKVTAKEDMEILDMEPEVREFVRKGDSRKTLQKKRQKREGKVPRWLQPGVLGKLWMGVTGRLRKGDGRAWEWLWPGKGRLPVWLWPLTAALVFLAVILCGILWLKITPVTVILAAVLEAVLAFLLCRSPIWLHGLVIVLNVVLGIIFPVLPYMVLVSLVYGVFVWALHMWGKR